MGLIIISISAVIIAFALASVATMVIWKSKKNVKQQEKGRVK